MKKNPLWSLGFGHWSLCWHYPTVNCYSCLRFNQGESPFMFRLTRPSVEDIRRYLNAQRGQPYSYSAVGATRCDNRPSGYNWDEHRVLLGYGESTYARARAAVERWAMFPRPLVRLYWPDAFIEPGTTV